MDLRGADSAVVSNVNITNESDLSGMAVIGMSGINIQHSANTDIMRSAITSDGTAIRLSNDRTADQTNTLFITNSSLTGKGSAALETTNGDTTVFNSVLTSTSTGDELACMNFSEAKNGCGALNLRNSNVQLSNNSAVYSNNVGVLITGQEKSALHIINSILHAKKEVFNVNSGKADIVVDDLDLSPSAPALTSDIGVLLNATNNSQVMLSLANIRTQGDFIADTTSSVSVLLNANTVLEGDMPGVKNLEVTRNADWLLRSDNYVGNVLLSGGLIALPENGSGEFHQLKMDTLTGTGIFRLHTSLQDMQGDRLIVKNAANGAFLLQIANSGLEPADATARLKVAETGGGSAVFAVYGGKVDAGVWQYGLIQQGNNWYLANGSVSSDPGVPDNPGVPDVPDVPGVPDNGQPVPERTTSPSTDAVLSLAAAPISVFNGELQNFRQRRGGPLNAVNEGVWGRYLNSRSHISTAMHASATLAQSGFEIGADKIRALPEGKLAVGALATLSDNTLRHARGGSSAVDSFSAGFYASWFDDSGWYVDGLLKASRFSNKLHTLMSNGTAVSGSYSQHALGGALEAEPVAIFRWLMISGLNLLPG